MRRLVFLFLFLSSFALLIAIFLRWYEIWRRQPPETEERAPGIYAPLLAREVDPKTQKVRDSVSVFYPEDRGIYLSLSAIKLPAESEIKARWIGREVLHPRQGVIRDLVLDESSIIVGGSNYVSFRLDKPQDNWLMGKYEVEIYLKEELVETVGFVVEAK